MDHQARFDDRTTQRTDIFISLLFFVIVVSLFPLGIGPEIATLKLIAPGVMQWCICVHAGTEHLFDADYRDGSLEQMMLNPQPLPAGAWQSHCALADHWITAGHYLAHTRLQYALSGDVLLAMIYALLGTPTLSLIGAIGAALTLGLNASGVLLALLVLPLYIPVLIFGAGAIEATASGLGGAAHLSMLGAILLLALIVTPLATAAALRIMSD